MKPKEVLAFAKGKGSAPGSICDSWTSPVSVTTFLTRSPN